MASANGAQIWNGNDIKKVRRERERERERGGGLGEVRENTAE